MSFEEEIKCAMIEYGACADNWKIKIIVVDRLNVDSDCANVIVNVWKPRSRKPDYSFILFVDVVKELIFWDRSTHINLKEKQKKVWNL